MKRKVRIVKRDRDLHDLRSWIFIPGPVYLIITKTGSVLPGKEDGCLSLVNTEKHKLNMANRNNYY